MRASKDHRYKWDNQRIIDTVGLVKDHTQKRLAMKNGTVVRYIETLAMTCTGQQGPGAGL
jgi:hypothetical protein